MEALGKARSTGPGGVQETTRRLGIDTSHFRFVAVVEAPPLPFTRRPAAGGSSGLSIAAKWFLARGYPVSLPLEPTTYDLIAESDDGLKRVQVKTTGKREKNGRFGVRTARKLYDSDVPANALGKYRMVPYTSADIDLFFIVTAAGGHYVIPVDVVGGRMNLVLDEKYGQFAVPE
jgi:hypothetical protein